MPREGGGVYDKGDGSPIKGLPGGMDPQGVPHKAPTGRPGFGGNPLGKNPDAAAKKGLDEAKRNG